MASLKDIKRKIGSVSNTQKTTRAMKLVSTAKLRRAEELAKRSRLYAQKMNQIVAEIAGRIQNNKGGGLDNRCFNEIENPKAVDIVFVTADKGLCGGFNIQTIKAVKKLTIEFENESQLEQFLEQISK
jgi:F-type H+-transporting ATPase subunit gamma